MLNQASNDHISAGLQPRLQVPSKRAGGKSERRRHHDGRFVLSAADAHIGPYLLRDVQAIADLFDGFDHDGSGEIDVDEFLDSDSWRSMSGVSQDELVSVFESIDGDESGTVSLLEMFKIAFPMATGEQIREMQNFSEQRKQVALKRAMKKAVRCTRWWPVGLGTPGSTHPQKPLARRHFASPQSFVLS